MVELCRSLVGARAFQRFITAVIIVAGALVGLETSSAVMAAYGGVVHALDKLVLAIFTAEILVRMIAEAPRPWRYFKDPWNCFDFAIVMGALLPFVSNYVTVLRLFRLLRVLRLVRAVPRLQVLVGALLHSLPSMAYVILLLSLLFYIYGVAGVFFFGPYSPQYFGDLGTAFLTLFQMVTLEDWVEILQTVRPHVPDVLSVTYFVSFIVIGTMVMLNLVIGVVLEGMKDAQNRAPASKRAVRDEGGHAPSADELTRLAGELDRLNQEMRRCVERLADGRQGAEDPRRPS